MSRPNKKNTPYRKRKPIAKWKYALFLTIWIVGGTLCLVLLLEGGLRVVGYGKNTSLFRRVTLGDGTRAWETNPDVVMRYIFRPPNTRIKDVGLALNTDILADPKPDGEKRVFFLGASTIYGTPHPANLTIPAQLEHLLASRYPGRAIQVINCAMTAISTFTLCDIANEIVRFEPDMVVIYAGHNEFYGPQGAASTVHLFDSERFATLFRWFTHTRTYQLVRRFDRGSAPPSESAVDQDMITLMGAMVGKDAIAWNGPAFEQSVERYRNRLDRIVQQLQDEEIPLVLCTLIANERDCGPLNAIARPGLSSEEKKALEDAIATAWECLREGDSDDAARRLGPAIELDPDNANVLFLQGRIAEARGDHRQAREKLLAARDRDGMRFRAPTVFNTVLRRIASERSVALADVEAVFEERSPHGRMGLNLFLDHVHPNLEGKYLAARCVAESIALNDLLDLESTGGAWLDMQACLTRVGMTPVDRLNGVARMIPFHRFYPLKNIVNREEVIQSLNDRMRVVEEGLTPVYRKVLAEIRGRAFDPKTEIKQSGSGEIAQIVTHDDIANALFKMGAFQEASEEFYGLIQSIHPYDPGLPNYYYHLAECLKRREDLTPDQRDPMLKSMYRACRSKFVRYSDRNGSLRARETLEMGSYAALSGDFSLASALFDESIRLDPKIQTMERLLLVHVALGNVEQARDVAKRILTMDPHHARALEVIRKIEANKNS